MNFKWSLFQKVINDSEQLSGKPIRELADAEIIDINCLRKWLIKNLYLQEQQKKERSLTDIKNELSDTYQISVSSIEKIVYGRRY